MSAPLLSARDIRVRFALPPPGGVPWRSRPVLQAVAGVSFDLEPGRTLGIVGESGCGKSTLARALLGLVPATGAAVWRDGTDLLAISPRSMKRYRAEIQMIFQDPLSALNPRMSVGRIVAEPLWTHRPDLPRREVTRRVREMMDRVGLLPGMIDRYPHEFSGGQCQRIGIARALIVAPKLLICDEPVSALDMSVRAQVVALLSELQRDLGLAILFIAHDLSLVRHLSDEIMVLYLGRMMEQAPADRICEAPQHPYTQALMNAVPVPDPAVERAKPAAPTAGELPNPLAPPSGCVFRTRCPRAASLCETDAPRAGDGPHRCACHFPGPPDGSAPG